MTALGKNTQTTNGPRNWLITGASGLLGHALTAALRRNGRTVTAVRSSHPVGVAGAHEVVADITNETAIRRLIAESGTEVVVHAAGLSSVDECQRHPEAAQRVHVDGTHNVARGAEEAGAKLVYISTDHLWDGTREMVDEDTPTYPINVYAETKLAGEKVALASQAHALSVRTNFFGRGRPWRRSFSDWILEQLANGAPLNMFTDVYFTPIALDCLSAFLIELVDRKCEGILHVAGGERLSKYEFAVKLAKAANYDPAVIRRASLGSMGLAAPRPGDMSLSTARAATIMGRPMPDADESIATLLADAAAKASAAQRL